MSKIRTLVLILLALSPVSAIAQYVLLNPTGGQIISQPSGTSLEIGGNGLIVDQGINFGEGGSYIGEQPAQGTTLITNSTGTLTLDAYSNSQQSSLVQVWLQQGDFLVADIPSNETFFCADTGNDFVGVAGANACSPFDLLDISNRETFGNGYMHWYANSSLGLAGPGGVVSGWNAGISNPSTGVISFDTTTDGNASGTIKVGAIQAVNAITMTQGATGGFIKFPDGTIQTTAFPGDVCEGVQQGGDYAESVDVTGLKMEFEPGDLIVMDPTAPGHFLRSSAPYSRLVAGIYSTKPGFVGRRQTSDSKTANEIPMAMVGIVPTKVTTENGAIKVGDLLVTSSKAGYAMKGTDPSALMGAVVGKALGSLDSGIGTIEVLVSLQ